MKIVSSAEEIENSPELAVNNYRWTEKPGPETRARAVYVENRGFLIEMSCLEAEPKAVHSEPDGPVHLDSCMEFFVNFDPEHDKRYVNLEAKSLGNLHCKIGEGRKNRQPLRELGCKMTEAEAKVGKNSWTLKIFIPAETVKALYGRDNFKSGDIIKGNFYKCGDETESPHFGMWSDIDIPDADFHRPEFFGEIVLEG